MGVTCQILINKPREGVQKAGRAVTGVVKYTVDKPTEYRQVALWFLGKGKCYWTERSGTSATSYRGSELFIIRHVNLKGSNDTVTLHGVYEFPFEFYLPEDSPTSHKDETGSIAYKIKLRLVKTKLFSLNKVFTAKIPVCGSVASSKYGGTDEGPVIFGFEKTLFTLFGRKSVVNLKAEMAKTCVTPGEAVHLTYKLTNDTKLTIPSVKTDLFCYTTYTANCGRTKKKCVRVKGCKTTSPGVPGGNVGVFSCALPTLAQLYSIQNSKVISREYRVRVTVRLPVPRANAAVEMPVALGYRRDFHCGDDLLPPSYWEVMTAMREENTGCQEKEKEPV